MTRREINTLEVIKERLDTAIGLENWDLVKNTKLQLEKCIKIVQDENLEQEK